MTTTVPTVNDLHKLQAKDAAHDEANVAEDAAIAILRADLDSLTARVAKLEGVPEPAPEPPVTTPPVESAPPVVSGLTRSRPFNPAAIVKTPADLIAAKMIPPFDAASRMSQKAESCLPI